MSTLVKKKKKSSSELVAGVSHLAGQLLVLLHQFLVLLVDRQHLADAVSSRLSLQVKRIDTRIHFNSNAKTPDFAFSVTGGGSAD